MAVLTVGIDDRLVLAVATVLRPLQTLPIAAVVTAAARIVGMVVLSGLLATVGAVVYRWYVRETIPEGLAVLFGLTGVAVYLNTTAALGQVIGGTAGLLDLETAVANALTFLFAIGGAVAGQRLGDRFGRAGILISGAREFNTEVGQLVRAVGRVIAVDLPDDIDDIEDIEGYDPVPTATKEALAGKTLVFPRRLTVEELRNRFITRLKDDYGIGHVGVEVTADGTIEYLGVGSRAAGIGPTLPRGMVAAAITADPAFAATSGDVVQIWRSPTGANVTEDDGSDGSQTTATPSAERVASGELRATAGDVVTLALDEGDAEMLDPTTTYRLMTLPTAPRADQEYASLLRAADETIGVVTIDEHSDLVGASIGAVDATIVAVKPSAGTIQPIPTRSHVLAPGDTIYAVARPELLRRLEAAAVGANNESPPPDAEPSL
ncbi:MAG: potassium transporter TrkA [Halobacteriales archaeon]|nr:potassium transporter TrkA [Halobacteriales archaeon]